MRTTVTLDPDVAMMLKKRMEEKDLTFKDTVNQLLILGLRAAEKEKKRKPYKVVPFSLQFKPGIDQTKLGQLLDQLDSEDFLRKMNR